MLQHVNVYIRQTNNDLKE